MISYWTNLNERERWTIGVGTCCTLIYIFYLFVYAPLTTAVADKTKQLQEKIATLAGMQEVRPPTMGKNKQQTISGSKLLTIIATQLNSSPFLNFPHQLQQTGQGDIQITFEKVPYTPFLTWLWTLGNNYSIVLKQLSVDRTETAGEVKIMLVINTK